MDAYLQAGLDALADRTRMAIFQRLASGPLAVKQIAEKLPVTRPAVSQHLKVLKEVGLVLDTPAGTRRLYSLNPEGLARLRAHFDQMWSAALAGFQAAAEAPATGDPDASQPRNRRPKSRSRQRAR